MCTQFVVLVVIHKVECLPAGVQSRLEHCGARSRDNIVLETIPVVDDSQGERVESNVFVT
jgi:hypothetical protein